MAEISWQMLRQLARDRGWGLTPDEQELFSMLEAYRKDIFHGPEWFPNKELAQVTEQEFHEVMEDMMLGLKLILAEKRRLEQQAE